MKFTLRRNTRQSRLTINMKCRNLFSYLTAAIVVSILSFSMLASCASEPEPVLSDLTPAQIFQQAQEAASNDKYQRAIEYYHYFLDSYPNETSRRVEAEYEIAFLTHKMGNDQEALRLFDALLEKYRSEEAAVYPQWPKVLATKVSEEIRQQQQGNQPPPATAAE